jgi:hypothetical protein
MSTKSPSMIARWHPIEPDKPSDPARPPPAGAASKLAIRIFLLLRSFPPQTAGW